jgi:hypothetical protein
MIPMTLQLSIEVLAGTRIQLIVTTDGLWKRLVDYFSTWLNEYRTPFLEATPTPRQMLEYNGYMEDCGSGAAAE